MALVETIIALSVLLVAAIGVMCLAVVAMTTTENQGHLQARTAEYAQDKMEQLLGLAYCDASTDTTQLPAVSSGGTGLGGCPTPLASPATGTSGVGGSSDPNNPVSGYVDYLDANGNLVTSTGGWYYKRVWQVALLSGTNTLKQITVTVQTAAEVGAGGALPRCTVSAIKTYPF